MSDDPLRKARLLTALADYLRQVDRAVAAQRQRILTEHADLAADLQAYFDACDHAPAVQLPQPPPIESPREHALSPPSQPALTALVPPAPVPPEPPPMEAVLPPAVATLAAEPSGLAAQVSAPPPPAAPSPPPARAAALAPAPVAPAESRRAARTAAPRKPAPEPAETSLGKPAAFTPKRPPTLSAAMETPRGPVVAEPPAAPEAAVPSGAKPAACDAPATVAAEVSLPADSALSASLVAAEAAVVAVPVLPPPEPDAPPGVVAGLRERLRDAPALLVSATVHLVLIIILGLLVLPAEIKRSLQTLVASTDLPAEDELETAIDIPLEEPEALLDHEILESLTATETIDTADLSSFDQDVENLALSDAPPAIDLGLNAISAESLAGPLTGAVGGGFEGRRGGNRAQIALASGGSAASEAAVDAALRWLAAHQNPDGGWSFNHQTCPACAGQCGHPGSSLSTTGATAMALLPFLGAGQTHKEGQYQQTIEAGLSYLVGQMQVNGPLGDLQGGGPPGSLDGGTPYTHGLATIALCEAYALTRDKRLAAPCQLAVNFICDFQDPVGGGWQYVRHSKGDLSVSGFQIMALKSAHLAYLYVPEQTIAGIYHFMDTVAGSGGATYGYMDADNPFAGTYGGAVGLPSTTAVGLVCRMYLGAQREHPAIAAGVQYLAQTGPCPTDMYYNYYATMVLHHFGGQLWEQWNSQMRDFLVQSQLQSGHEAGSWTPFGAWGSYGGRLMDTSFSCMTLEVYYRHMPLYQQQSVAEEDDFGDLDLELE